MNVVQNPEKYMLEEKCKVYTKLIEEGIKI